MTDITQNLERMNRDVMMIRDPIYVPEIDLHFIDKRIVKGVLNRNYQTTKDVLKDQKMAMPTPSQFRAFLKHLRNSQEQEHQDLYRNLSRSYNQYLSTWLNARFEERDGGMYMISEDVLIDGECKDQELKLNDCLMNDRRIPHKGISLDEWLDSTTPHGLPYANIPDGDLFYSHPMDGRVAWFGSYNTKIAQFSCEVDPKFHDYQIGSFGVCKKDN